MKNYRIEAIILAIGTLMLGVFIYWGLSAFAAKDRVVDVRGLAEREVKADKVIWPITYKTTGNDLQTIYTDLNNVNDRIAIFLTSNGVAKTDISVGAPQIVDLRAERYGSADDIKTRDRYNVTSIITVSSSHSALELKHSRLDSLPIGNNRRMALSSLVERAPCRPSCLATCTCLNLSAKLSAKVCPCSALVPVLFFFLRR